ncbi:hypothetical protein Acr_00g0049960 [Actinidia rufa]|uniref:Retrovirus-related Pol polyprotein from transposon TNT 1-94-like beta-barrel domain-containing protein n=1 Tax=Actinidia rufa TaxID=165716 RepID=A0A7J0DKN4_9ERIC|nr:hypothetical protein Acr_00g0049960 [Actinidia rufa]
MTWRTRGAAWRLLRVEALPSAWRRVASLSSARWFVPPCGRRVRGVLLACKVERSSDLAGVFDVVDWRMLTSGVALGVKARGGDAEASLFLPCIVELVPGPACSLPGLCAPDKSNPMKIEYVPGDRDAVLMWRSRAHPRNTRTVQNARTVGLVGEYSSHMALSRPTTDTEMEVDSGLRADCCEARLRGKTERDCEKGCCFSRRYEAPAPNRVGNRVRTRPHAPFEDQRVRLVSTTRPGSLALPEVSRHSGFISKETSAYDLWIKLEEMYQVKTSRNKALLMRRLVNLKFQRETTMPEHPSEFQSLVNQLTNVDLQFDDEMQALLLLSSLLESWETLVVSLSNSAPNGKLTTSMVMDALFNEEAQRREMGSTDQSESQALVSEISRKRGLGAFIATRRGISKRDCPKYKAQDQSSDTAATAVMAVDESEVLLAASEDGKSDWVLDSGSAYHLLDREVFSTYAACEGRIWMANNTSSRVIGRESVRFRMADRRSVTLTEVRHVPNLRKNLISIGMLDSKGCSFEASGGILRVSNGNKEMLWEKKTRGLYRLEGNVQTGGATVRHGSSGISKKSGQGKQPLHRGTQSKRRGTWRIQSGTRAQGDALGYVRKSGQTRVLCAQGRRDGSSTTRKVTYFAAHPGGGCGAPQWGGVQGTSSYGGAGSEAVRKDNLKTSDYPLVGWRGRLLSPAHLDESKPTWMSPSPVAKPKPDWSSYRVSM